MTYTKLATLAAASLLASVASAALIPISNFGNSAFVDEGWTYNSGSSSLSGQEGLGNLIYGTPLTVDFTGIIAISLTANVTAGSAPANGFTFLLLDGQDDSVTAVFDWSQFIGGATVEANISANPLFDFANVTTWNLVGGSSNSPIAVTLTNVSGVTPVPEPSSYSTVAALGAIGFAMLRRRARS
jgi:hypothetical protein